MIENVPVINWFEDPIKQSITSVFGGLNSYVESLDLIKKYRNTHFEILIPIVKFVKILGMQKSIPLDELYYPTTVSTDIRRRIYSPEWMKIDKNTSQIRNAVQKTVVPGDEFIELNPRTVVLGGPGAGKTTFLKYLALAYSEKTIFEKTKLKTSFLPAYIHLPSLPTDSIDFLHALKSKVEQRTDENAEIFYRRLLETGNIVVLLDSLDEVPSDAKKTMVNAISDFCSLYPRARIVISCRTADYQNVFVGFAEVEVARLSQGAVKTIIKGWFNTEPKKAEKLLTTLETDPTIASLTETPLLLSLLCIQYRNDLVLPNRKTELYRRCVDALLRDWDASRNFRRDSHYSQLSDDRKETIFENIAGSTSGDSIDYEFSEAVALGVVSDTIARFGLSANDSRHILIEIESHHGIVEKCSADLYQFSHGTMHEYFIARYIVARRTEMQILRSHFEDSRWHTVIAFICAILNDPSPLLEFLVSNSSTENFRNYPTFGKRLAHLLLLHRCMSMGVAISPVLRASICEHLVSSQIHMIKRLNMDGVLPYAARRQHGVRQSILHYSRPRSSIDKLLLPYRSLMNEVWLSPLPDYVEQVLRQCEIISKNLDMKMYERIGLLTCLLVPISEVRPQEFINYMFSFSNELLRNKAESIRYLIVESIAIHQKSHPNITASDNIFDLNYLK